MTTNITKFANEVLKISRRGEATEHSYRAAIRDLFRDIGNGVDALNEPKQVECGAPDFLVTKNEFSIGYVEAKNVGVNLEKMSKLNHDQKMRYQSAFSNLIYTNCYDWQFYREGNLVKSISIGKFSQSLKFNKNLFGDLKECLDEFISCSPQTITDPRDLAERMAGKARLVSEVLLQTLKMDKDQSTSLYRQFLEVESNLIPGINFKEFSTMYAETITHGMVVARLNSKGSKFTRQDALDALPKTNPFLRNFFGYIASIEIDDQIRWIIDDLAFMFQSCDVKKLMKEFNDDVGKEDPFLHFYETFLAFYDPEDRRAYGVWHTPQQVVSFIVRAVDFVLKEKFDLLDGLSDTSKVMIDFDTGSDSDASDKITEQKEVHRVQIMDPATGTGTFLVEVIKQIAPKISGGGGRIFVLC